MLQVHLELFRGDIEDEDQHAHVLEDMVSLRLEVLLHEAILAAAIPQAEDEVAEETNSLLVHVDGEGDLVRITGQLVGEDD